MKRVIAAMVAALLMVALVSSTAFAGNGAPGAVGITVNISLSVDATSDPAVYDAFFAAMAKHLSGLVDGGA